LVALDADRWAGALRDPDGDLATLTLRIAEQGTNVTLGTDFVDGLLQYARDMLSKEKPIGATNQISELVDLLAPHHRSGLPAKLYRMLDDAQAKAKRGFFSLFGEMMGDRPSPSDQPQCGARECESMLQEENLA